jgi:hypothetical protein
VISDFRIALTFNDGAKGDADLSVVCIGDDCGIYDPLTNREFSRRRKLS